MNTCAFLLPCAGLTAGEMPSSRSPAAPLYQFQAAERGGPFGSSAFFTPIFSAARRAGYGAHHVQPSGLSQVSARRFLLALSLVQSPQKSSSGSAQVFHTVLSPFVHALNLAWRSKHDVQRNSASGAQSNE